MDLKRLQITPPWDWPKDSAKTFRKILTDRRADASDRLIAADLAGDYTVINDELADILLSIIGNSAEPELLRARAAISLGPALESANEGFDDPDEIPIREQTFLRIQKSLRKFYTDPGTPKEVRRRILEASVRAPEDWHTKAVGEAYASGDQEWMLTAVFAMRWISGFDQQILEALESPDPEIYYEAVMAAGESQVDAAWDRMVNLVQSAETEKPLLLAAIAAVGMIRPEEAAEILGELADSEDEDIAEAADEALMMAETLSGDGLEEDEQ